MNWIFVIKFILIGTAVLILFGLLEIILLFSDPFYRISRHLAEIQAARENRRRAAEARIREISPVRKLRR